MRNIKFRAFIKDSHEMASLPTSEIYKVTEIDFADKYVTVEDDNRMIDVVGFEDCELLQFTGMTDTDGTEIYEGDLFDVYLDYFKHGQTKKVIGEVVFENGVYFIQYKDPEVNEIRNGILAHFLSNKKKSIIGSIHENSAILTQ